jgi:hypothetical protein
MRNKIFVFLTALLMITCQSGKEGDKTEAKKGYQFIDLSYLKPNTKKLKLSDIAQNIEYISLETCDDCLLTKIIGANIFDKYIFIGFLGKIYQFNTNGKFIRELYRIGKGPGECFGRDYAINYPDSTIYVYGNWTHKFNIYSSEGHFVRSFDDPNQPESTLRFTIYNNKLISELSFLEFNEYFFSVFDLENGKTTYSHKNNYEYKITNTNRTYSLIDINSTDFQEFNNHFLFKEHFCDTLYQTTDFSDILPRYIFNLGKYKLEYRNYYSKNYPVIDDMFVITSFFETSFYLFFIIQSFNERYIGILEKRNNKLKITEELYVENDLDGGLEFDLFKSLTWKWFQEDQIYFFIQPYELIETMNSESSTIDIQSELFQIGQSINENDNPVLVKVTLKK